jgi:precorrin-2 methylase
MLEDNADESIVRPQADQIVQDYIREGTRQWEIEMPHNVQQDLMAIMDENGEKITAELDTNLFSSLYFYVLEVLEDYYKEF